MSMRTREELQADASRAFAQRDLGAMRRLAAEAADHNDALLNGLHHHLLAKLASVENRTDDAVGEYRRAAESFEGAGDRASAARMLGGIAMISYSAGRFEEARENYVRTLEIFSETDNDLGRFSSHQNIGIIDWHFGRFNDALHHASMALKIAQDRNALEDVSGAMSTIALVYESMGRYDDAISYFKNSLDVGAKSGDAVGQARVKTSLSAVLIRMGDYEEAVRYATEAYHEHERLNDRNAIATTLLNIGIVHQHTGGFAEALTFYQRALDHYESLQATHGISSALVNIASVHAELGERVEAVRQYERALELQLQLADAAGIERTRVDLCRLYFETNNIPRALELLEVVERSAVHDPERIAWLEILRSRRSMLNNDAHEAEGFITGALQRAVHSNIKVVQQEAHDLLRDCAEQRNDLVAYVHHTKEYERVHTELHALDSTRRILMMESQRRLDQEKAVLDRHRTLLHSALPPHIAELILNDRSTTTSHEQAAILFADIAGFTTRSANLPPERIVRMLDEIFRAFDQLCEQYEVMKIKTIGDAFMCMKSDQEAHVNARGLADVAIAIRDHPRTWPDGSPLIFRIGLHIGPVTAGVIGTQRLQYDIWGDTVNVASRMESTGEPGRIHISEEFAKAVKPYRTTHRGMIDVKGKGSMTTFWLDAKGHASQ